MNAAIAELRRAVDDLVQITNVTSNRRFAATHDMSPRQIEMLLAGGLINLMRERLLNR